MPFDRMGLRGIAHETVTWDLVVRYARTAGEYVDADRMAVGRDTRTTGELFVHAATVGLLRAGLDVHLLGIVPTPALQHYAGQQAIGGIQVTASHNPREYTGLKVVGTDGSVLPFETTRSLQEAVRVDDDTESADGESAHGATWSVDDGPAAMGSTGSSRRVEGANDRYVERILAAVDADSIRERSPTVVLDPGNGAGSMTSPALLRRLGCRVHTLDAQPDGTFPGRDPEPTGVTLSTLREMVSTSGAALGVAHDGDADRTVFVDETGRYVDGNAAFAALVAAAADPGKTVVTPVNASQRVVDAVDACDGTLAYTRIGNAHIIDRIRALQKEDETVAIAGEGNGGVIYPGYHLGRDGGYTAAKFLELVADRPASAVLDPHRGYHFERRNVSYSDDGEREQLMENAAEWAASTEGETTSIDGYRVDFGDAWALVRPSGTEPYVRIYAESRSEERTSSLLATIEEHIA